MLNSGVNSYNETERRINMSQFININSQLDALRMKEFEKKFYERISDDVKIVPKVTPFKGINIDLMCVKDNKILFVKFMDTS